MTGGDTHNYTTNSQYLTNSIVGVLTRFRTGPVAFMVDVESMFYQVHVPPNQRNFLRFVWWPNGNLQSDPEVYQMNVHLLGATSSSGVANYALRQAGNASCTPMIILHPNHLHHCDTDPEEFPWPAEINAGSYSDCVELSMYKM